MTTTIDTRPSPTDDPDRSGAPGGPIGWVRDHWYGLGLVVVAGAALAIRLMNVLVLRPTCKEDIVAIAEAHGAAGFDANAGTPGCFGVWGDAAYYYIQGRQIARGNWFIESYAWFSSAGTVYKPSAGDPPLFSLFLGMLARLGITSGTGMRVATSFVGVVGVILLALLVRKLVGRRAAIIAGLLAAVYPMLWINDGMLLSETLYVPLILVALHAAYHFWERPSYRSAALFGVAMALAALTRGEALILFAVMALPLAWGLRSYGWRRCFGWIATTGAVGALLIAPWIIYNHGRFKDPVYMTSSTGAVLSSANCDTTYYGGSTGYYANCFDEYVQKGQLIGKIPGCDQAAVDAANIDPSGLEAGRCWPSPDEDESQRDKYSLDLAIQYMKDHKRRLPVVMAARVGRMW